jgi:hypothetical protein
MNLTFDVSKEVTLFSSGVISLNEVRDRLGITSGSNVPVLPEFAWPPDYSASVTAPQIGISGTNAYPVSVYPPITFPPIPTPPPPVRIEGIPFDVVTIERAREVLESAGLLPPRVAPKKEPEPEILLLDHKRRIRLED